MGGGACSRGERGTLLTMMMLLFVSHVRPPVQADLLAEYSAGDVNDTRDRHAKLVMALVSRGPARQRELLGDLHSTYGTGGRLGARCKGSWGAIMVYGPKYSSKLPWNPAPLPWSCPPRGPMPPPPEESWLSWSMVHLFRGIMVYGPSI